MSKDQAKLLVGGLLIILVLVLFILAGTPDEHFRSVDYYNPTEGTPTADQLLSDEDRAEQDRQDIESILTDPLSPEDGK